jgi:hypothetical protein
MKCVPTVASALLTLGVKPCAVFKGPDRRVSLPVETAHALCDAA